MTTLLLSHQACLDHATPPGHPERADRLRAVGEVLGQDRFNALVRGEAPEGSLDSVTLCHGEHYVGELRHIAPSSGLIYIDGDTSMSRAPGSRMTRRRRRGHRHRCGDVGYACQTHSSRYARRSSRRINKRWASASSTTQRSPRASPAQWHRACRGGRFRVHHGNGTQDIFWSDRP